MEGQIWGAGGTSYPSPLHGSCCPLFISWGHGLATQASDKMWGDSFILLCLQSLLSPAQGLRLVHVPAQWVPSLVLYCGTLGLRWTHPGACSRLPACYCVTGRLLNLSPLKPQLSNLEREDVILICRNDRNLNKSQRVTWCSQEAMCALMP